MNIAVVGAGRVGQAVGTGWARAGHSITFGVRAPESERIVRLITECGPRAKATTVSACADGSDVIFLAVPWLEAKKVIEQLGDLSGKILIDATNPIVIGADEASRGLLIGHTTSAGEQVARWAPAARVVKAFNTIGAGNMRRPVYGKRRAVTFVASDDAQARALASTLARDLGVEPVDTGDLTSARLLEPIGFLWIKMAYGLGWGEDFAFDVLKASETAGD